MDNVSDSASLITISSVRSNEVTEALVNEYNPSKSKDANKKELNKSSTKRVHQQIPKIYIDTGEIQIVEPEPQPCTSRQKSPSLKEKRSSESRISWTENWVREIKNKMAQEETINLVDSPEQKGSLEELLNIPRNIFFQKKSAVTPENIEMTKIPDKKRKIEDGEDIIEEITVQNTQQNSCLTFDNILPRESLIASGFVLFVNTSFIGFVIYVLIAYFQYRSS